MEVADDLRRGLVYYLKEDAAWFFHLPKHVTDDLEQAQTAKLRQYPVRHFPHIVPLTVSEVPPVPTVYPYSTIRAEPQRFAVSPLTLETVDGFQAICKKAANDLNAMLMPQFVRAAFSRIAPDKIMTYTAYGSGQGLYVFLQIALAAFEERYKLKHKRLAWYCLFPQALHSHYGFATQGKIPYQAILANARKHDYREPKVPAILPVDHPGRSLILIPFLHDIGAVINIDRPQYEPSFNAYTVDMQFGIGRVDSAHSFQIDIEDGVLYNTHIPSVKYHE